MDDQHAQVAAWVLGVLLNTGRSSPEIKALLSGNNADGAMEGVLAELKMRAQISDLLGIAVLHQLNNLSAERQAIYAIICIGLG
jgi:hypothetical protein